MLSGRLLTALPVLLSILLAPALSAAQTPAPGTQAPASRTAATVPTTVPALSGTWETDCLSIDFLPASCAKIRVSFENNTMHTQATLMTYEQDEVLGTITSVARLNVTGPETAATTPGQTDIPVRYAVLSTDLTPTSANGLLFANLFALACNVQPWEPGTPRSLLGLRCRDYQFAPAGLESDDVITVRGQSLTFRCYPFTSPDPGSETCREHTPPVFRRVDTGR